MSRDLESIWSALSEVMDPEIPVISLKDLGIIREVHVENGTVQVVITPTFSGCPALHTMRGDIRNRLKEAGFENVEVLVRLSPPWTTDDISEAGREKLKAFGITPPPQHGGRIGSALLQPVQCPYCDSIETTLENAFGPTPCRMIFTCQSCNQPFEQFKPL